MPLRTILTVLMVASLLPLAAGAPPATALAEPVAETAAAHRAEPRGAGANCGDVHIIGIAGSGEQGSKARPKPDRYGSTVGRLIDLIERPLTKQGVRVRSTPIVYYPEDAKSSALDQLIHGRNSQYERGVKRGIKATAELLRSRVRSCPRELQVLAAYSQGGQVAIRALNSLGSRTSSPNSHVLAVALVANPYSTSDDPSIGVGSAPPGHKGIYFVQALVNKYGFPPKLGRQWLPHAFEACAVRDEVCDYSLGALGNGVHAEYSAGNANLLKKLATIVRERVDRMPREDAQSVHWLQGQEHQFYLSTAKAKVPRTRLRYELRSGSFAPGTRLSPNGFIISTPVETGTFTAKISVSNPAYAPGVHGTITFVMEVDEGDTGRPWRTISPSHGICGIRADDSGYCWSSIFLDPCPLENNICQPDKKPRRVTGDWRTLRADGNDICGIKLDKSGWCWGFNSYGTVGDGTTESRHRPVRVPGSWRSIEIKAFGSTCGVMVDGSGWCWGSNRSGELGDGTTVNRRIPTRVPGEWRQIQQEGFDVVSCGIRVDGSGWCWGANGDGEVDGNSSEHVISSPHQVQGAWVDLQPGQRQSCGLKTDGTVWCSSAEGWAEVALGQKTESIWGDGRTWCAVMLDGAAICWGEYPGTAEESDSRAVHKLDGTGWSQFSITSGMVCGVREAGDAWCWGNNNGGTVGNGTRSETLTPYRLPGSSWSEVVTDYQYTCGVQMDGTGWCWGGTYVGDGTTSERLVPSLVP